MLATVSTLALLLLLSAALLVKIDAPYANYIALALTATMISSVYVVISLIELKLAGKLMNMKSGLSLWLSVIGLLIWFSKIDAQVEVNNIFGVDASLLPMTTAAATFMHVMIRTEPAIYTIMVVSAVLFIFSYPAARLRKEIPLYAICHTSNLLTFIVIASLVSNVISLDRRRNQILYHIAHMADFSSKSPCANVNSLTEDVLYLDSVRSKILVAPKIKEHEPTTLSTFSLLAPTLVPSDFKRLNCDYKLPLLGSN
ncbi:hypothetical protein [Pseudomonas sp. DR 5-09]|uniref:hypothetical protein n=1 Tax=Pseudomonas sp. DR 5-09 TaxID=1534110 RepID=UPI000B206AE4|nr:hypothetical protein [Pseudomonas sp. DR 5-09]